MRAAVVIATAVLAASSAACGAPAAVVTPQPWRAPPTCPAEGCDGGHPAGAASAGAPDVCPGAGDAPCAGSRPDECRERALAAWSDAHDDRDLACVARTLADACSLGDAPACGFAGRLWLDGRGVPADVVRGMGMLVRACDDGVALSCMVALRWLADADHARRVRQGARLRARLDVEHGCLVDNAEDCFRVGYASYTGRDGFARDPKRAVEAYARGCNLGHPYACNNLGDALAYGEGVARDVRRAAATFGKACHLGEPLGCANYGFMLEHGEGVARDAARARALYRDACTSGEVYGCLHAEMMQAQDAGAPRDMARALAQWERACAARDARACAFVGVVYEDGPDGYARDEAKSLRAMQRACRLGNERACDWMKSRSSP
jgi:TPR repeat protein